MDKLCASVWAEYQSVRKRAREYDASSLEETLLKSAVQNDGDCDEDYERLPVSAQKKVRRLCEHLGI